jgi:superfamily I DNA/RNA helicase
VPYRVIGGNRFFDRKEVREVLGYLKAVHNPTDHASLLRIANVPKRGLGPQTLLRLREEAAQRGISLRAALAQGLNLSPQGRAGAKALLSVLDTYGKRFRAEGLTSQGLRDLVRDSGLRAEVEATYESRQAVERRLELLEELARWVDDSRRGGKVDLGSFIEKLSLDPPGEKDGDEGEAVSLLTLHSAKGLEFPVVFLTGMEEGLLPHTREAGEPSARDADEERRLCYVGMTRAREKLYLCHAKTRRRRGGPLATLPSRFLAEIPLDLTDRGGAAAERDPEEEKAMAKNFFQGIRGMLS